MFDLLALLGQWMDPTTKFVTLERLSGGGDVRPPVVSLIMVGDFGSVMRTIRSTLTVAERVERHVSRVSFRSKTAHGRGAGTMAGFVRAHMAAQRAEEKRGRRAHSSRGRQLSPQEFAKEGISQRYGNPVIVEKVRTREQEQQMRKGVAHE
jgi:hypothetical protein